MKKRQKNRHRDWLPSQGIGAWPGQKPFLERGVIRFVATARSMEKSGFSSLEAALRWVDRPILGEASTAKKRPQQRPIEQFRWQSTRW